MVVNYIQYNLAKTTPEKDYGGIRHFQQYISYIVVVSFIGGRNRSN